MTLDSSQTYKFLRMKSKCDHSVPIFLDQIVENDRDSSSTSFSDNLVDQNFTILHPKHGKLSRIKVLTIQLTVITSYRPKTLIQNGPQTKERAITDKMLNSALADLISIDQTTAFICASVFTRARY